MLSFSFSASRSIDAATAAAAAAAAAAVDDLSLSLKSYFWPRINAGRFAIVGYWLPVVVNKMSASRSPDGAPQLWNVLECEEEFRSVSAGSRRNIEATCLYNYLQ